jgi:spermidine synthase
MRALDAPLRAAGVVLLNEVGLDLGINHFYAVKTTGGCIERGEGACIEF